MLRATVPRVELPRGSRFIRNSRAFSNILFSYTSTILIRRYIKFSIEQKQKYKVKVFSSVYKTKNYFIFKKFVFFTVTGDYCRKRVYGCDFFKGDIERKGMACAVQGLCGWPCRVVCTVLDRMQRRSTQIVVLRGMHESRRVLCSLCACNQRFSPLSTVLTTCSLALNARPKTLFLPIQFLKPYNSLFTKFYRI